MTAALVAIAGVGILWGAFALLLARSRKEHRQTEAELARVRSLSAAEAKELALQELRRDKGWCLRAAPSEASATLPPAVAPILSEYDEIVRGEFWIGRSALLKGARLPGFIKIGEDFELCELMVKPTGVEVFSSYGDHEAPEVSPTVWHKILEIAEVKV